ncbi:MAG: U32 family peptidase, partial [Lachnospiraceae bacterium]|nr:U32 family peptidase [Lachnospiraceae bacterium]
MRRPELLAPAGDLSCLRAAIGSGADAVYFGGELFNARKNAGNFDLEEIAEAVRLCRLHGVRTNFTLNTLIKDSEWPELISYLDKVLALGIDALIIQDMGVAAECARRIAERYPHVQLHGSTQMAVEDADGASYLKSLGFSRVVLARELSLEEIRTITESVDIETEVFIHGALCYSDSGRCLLSSFHGGRSGNRGTCAQACRLPYIVDGHKEFYMNLKDRCCVESMPALLEAGVSSFKIEGRMKGVPYVASVTDFYRKLLDRYTQNRPFREQQSSFRTVKQIFNRGNFTEGYFVEKKDMIDHRSVKHQGIEIGEVIRAKDHSIQIRSMQELHSGDELEILTSSGPLPIRLNESMLSRDHKSASFRLGGKIRERQSVRRLVDPVLNQKLRDRALAPNPLPVNVALRFLKYEPMVLTVSCEGQKVTMKGAVVEEAQNIPVRKEQLEKLLTRTGEDYVVR